MAGATADVGHLTTVAFGTTVWVMNIKSISWSGISRAAHDSSYLGTAAAASSKWGNRTFVASELVDGGTVTLSGHLDTTQTVTTKQFPIGAAAETMTVTLPQTGGTAPASFAATAICTECSMDIPEDGIMNATAAFKISGNVTITAAT